MRADQFRQRHRDMLHTAFGAEINALLNDPKILEIMVNPDGKLWAETIDKGMFYTEIQLSRVAASNIIKLTAACQQAIVDAERPEVSCELPQNNARFQGWLPPIARNPTFAIRKRARQIFSLADYVAMKGLAGEQASWLSSAIKSHKNILIAGSTSSGKTTFANALLNELTESQDRIFILEDLPELQIHAANHVRLCTSSNITMRNLVKSILHMRPDRIIIGEVRDDAALELLKAWNTGHPGGISTIHANSPEATLSRLEDLIREAVNVIPKRLISEAIDIIVFIHRNEKGNYKIASIHELGINDLCKRF